MADPLPLERADEALANLAAAFRAEGSAPPLTPAGLREARQRLGLTQADLADAMGYAKHRQTISGKENGRKPITGRDAKMIAALIEKMEGKKDG